MEFNDIFLVVNDKKKQILASQILKNGKIPVIDQGQSFVAGFSNTSSYHTNVPVILFGDHTLSLKFIDFPFVVGADGVQILKAKSDNFYSKFLYYLLEKKNKRNTCSSIFQTF